MMRYFGKLKESQT